MDKHLPTLITRVVKLCSLPVAWIAGIVTVFSPSTQRAQAQVIPTANGAGTAVSESGGQHDITGGTPAGDNLFHEFDQFDLSAAETANFLSDSGVFNIVGQISGGNPSYIDGNVQVTGSDANLYLVNPSGVLFGPNAQLSLQGSFTATTADQVGFGEAWLDVSDSNSDYTNLTAEPSAYRFTQGDASAIVNYGELSVEPGESIALIGGNVINTGTVEAPGGEIALVAVGESTVRMTTPGSLLSLEVEESVLATGNAFSTTDLPTLLTGGSIPQPTSLTVQANGNVKLGGVNTEFEEVVVSGVVSTAGDRTSNSTFANGGNVILRSNSVDILDATIDASGENGGTISIGNIDPGAGSLQTTTAFLSDRRSEIRADGRNGSGGDINVSADLRVRMQGNFSAQGTTSGGNIETIANQIDTFDLTVNAGGGSGSTGGRLRLEQAFVEIDDSSNSIANSFNQLEASVIESVLDMGTNVEIATKESTLGNGDIALTTSINQSGGGGAFFTFTGRQFEDNGNKINLTSTGPLTFELNAVEAESTPSASSIESAIAAIGNVSGQRIINLNAGNYEITNTIDVTTDVEIQGRSAADTSLTTRQSGIRALSVDAGVTAAIRDVTLTTAGLRSSDSGGGIVNRGQLTVENSELIDNRSAQDGGAIATTGSRATLNLENTSFTNNRSQGNGGAVFSDSGTTTRVSNTRFESNQASGAQSNGGALAIMNSAAVTITDTEVENNSATEKGAGLFLNDSSTATITGSLTRDQTGRATSATTHFANNTAGRDGGGIAALDTSQLNVSGVFLQGNSSGDDGGGISVTETSHAVIDNVNFENNTTAQNGGGLYSNNVTSTIPSQDKITLTNSYFIENEANISGGGFHQGINSAATVNNTVFQDNTATTDGGGIHVSDGSLTLADSQLIANQARFGGGLEVSLSGEVTVSDSSISKNIASQFGGGIQADPDTTLELQRSTVEGNVADSGGGLINRGTTRVVNSTFSGNVADDVGGAIHSDGSDATLTVNNSTITANEARSSGGGIIETNSRLAQLQNTIVAGNIGPISADIRGRFTNSNNNLIGSNEGATGFFNSRLAGTASNPINPRLAALANNGGPTQTHLLLDDSPAIDAGTSVGSPAIDQRGSVRPEGLAADIGAVELSATGIATENTGTGSTGSTGNTGTSSTEIENPPEPETSTSPSETVIEAAIETIESVIAASSPDSLTNSAIDELDAERNTLRAQRTTHHLENADTAIRRLEQSFSQDFKDYWDLSAGDDPTFSEVQAVLRRAQAEYAVNSAVIYATFAPDTPEAATDTILQVDPAAQDDDVLTLSIVLPEGELVSYALPVTRKEISRQIRYFRSAVSDLEDDRSYKPLAQQLYQWLLAPLEVDLAAQNVQNVMYALDDGLRTAPIAAMRDDSGFSLERYGISVVPSMGLMQADFPVEVRRSTIAMGVSEFSQEAPLPAVPIELAVVDQFVPVSQTVLNEETTLDALKGIQALEQPGVLHLATHASFNRRSPEESFIHLWNEPLSMKEFSTLGWGQSDLELLILSACSTAMSSRNAELGFAGLAAAAGVDATVGSLWEVSDVGTLALMSEFYAQLETNELRFEALRQAQLALLKGDARIEAGNLVGSHGVVDLPDEWNLPDSATLDHPFFWSAFTMVGNPW